MEKDCGIFHAKKLYFVNILDLDITLNLFLLKLDLLDC